MSDRARRVVVMVALAAMAAIVWWYLERRRKAREEETRGQRALRPALDETASVDAAGAAVYVADEEEALARVVASEAGRQSPDTQVRIGWVARNRAQRAKTTVAKLVCQPCGRQVGNRRPLSSSQAPLPRHREIARQVLAAPDWADPTRGATSILEPSLMDRLYAAGKARWDASGVRRRWLRGLDYYGSAGGWDFFGPKGGPGAQPVPAAWGLASAHLA